MVAEDAGLTRASFLWPFLLPNLFKRKHGDFIRQCATVRTLAPGRVPPVRLANSRRWSWPRWWVSGALAHANAQEPTEIARFVIATDGVSLAARMGITEPATRLVPVVGTGRLLAGRRASFPFEPRRKAVSALAPSFKARAGGRAGRHSTAEPVQRVKREFLEMPGLRLTVRQAARLWAFEPIDCERLLEDLVEARFLFRMRDGTYARRDLRELQRQ